MIVRALVTTEEGRRMLPMSPRAVYGTNHSVVDLYRQDQLALVICVRCGATWTEGAAYGEMPLACEPFKP